MIIGIQYAARSDVGMLREGNEDSAYAGARLLVVADGMGGHVGGEIASAAAVNALKPLDAEVPINDLMPALQQAVKQANENLHGIVETDPSLQGMGTTLTAMLWSGPHVALVHIGDSRAYLLRNGELFQITHDHTLVQSLVDEGRITVDEAASHPQRSLLLRALDGRGEVEPDVSRREAHIGDRYLLCSDGLSGVVSAETIHQVLTQVEDPQMAVRQLIDLANRGGGPDNITCVIADVVELPQPQPPGTHAVVAGAAANAGPRSRGPHGGGPGPGQGAGPGTVPTMADGTPAQRAAALRDTAPQPPIALDEAPMPVAARPGARGPRPTSNAAPTRRGWTWLVVAVGLFVVLLAVGGYAGWRLLESGYYVGDDRGAVVIYQGSPDGVFGLGKAKIKERPSPTILLADLPKAEQDSVRENSTVDSIAKAHAAVDSLRTEMCQYTIVEDRGQVVIVKGKGQPKCGTPQIIQSTQQLAFKDLPTPRQDQVQKTIKTKGFEDAKKQFSELVNAAKACQSDLTVSPECPQQTKKTP